jgi:hypothetical protein
MNWTMPYPWRSRSDSVRRINISREPGNEIVLLCLAPPYQEFLAYNDEIARVKFRLARPRAKDGSGCSRAGCESVRRALPLSTTGYVRSQLA